MCTYIYVDGSKLKESVKNIWSNGGGGGININIINRFDLKMLLVSEIHNFSSFILHSPNVLHKALESTHRNA